MYLRRFLVVCLSAVAHLFLGGFMHVGGLKRITFGQREADVRASRLLASSFPAQLWSGV
jgi:hypothetical protein